MDDPKQEPLLFSDRVIHKFVGNLFGETLALEPKDLALIKSVFCSCGGSWESIVKGDMRQVLILEQAVIQWGSQPNRKKQPSA